MVISQRTSVGADSIFFYQIRRSIAGSAKVGFVRTGETATLALQTVAEIAGLLQIITWRAETMALVFHFETCYTKCEVLVKILVVCALANVIKQGKSPIRLAFCANWTGCTTSAVRDALTTYCGRIIVESCLTLALIINKLSVLSGAAG